MAYEDSFAADPMDAAYFDSEENDILGRIKRVRRIASENTNKKKKSSLSSAAKGAIIGAAIGAGIGIIGKKSPTLREIMQMPTDSSTRAVMLQGLAAGGATGGVAGYSLRSASNKNIDKSKHIMGLSDKELDEVVKRS